VERVAASHKLHVLVARRLIVGKVLPPIDGHLEPRLPFVDQDLCKEAIIPAVTAIFRVMSRVELCAVGLPTTRTCAQQCCARGVVPEHRCWAIVVGTTHGGQGECGVCAFWGAGYMFGRHEFACRSSRLSKWIVIARQRWRLSSFSSRGLTRHWTLPRTNPRDSPGPRSGSRPGPAPVEKHETGPISYLIDYVDRRGRPTRAVREFLSYLLVHNRIHAPIRSCAYVYRTVTSGPERT